MNRNGAVMEVAAKEGLMVFSKVPLDILVQAKAKAWRLTFTFTYDPKDHPWGSLRLLITGN